MKKIIILFLLFVFIFNQAALAETLHGGIEETNTWSEQQKEMFTGEVEKLEKKDVIEMTVSQVLDSNLSVEGDEFFAEVTSEVYGDEGVILPKGTIAHGKIVKIEDPKKLGRSGWIELDFDYLMTPDGREIPIEGKMSTKLHPIVETTKIMAQDVGYTALGGVAGGFLALNWLARDGTSQKRS